jgi:potassium/hydrogen antiporter
VRPRPRLFTTGPWDAGDGDPGDPQAVSGIPVVRRLRMRLDPPGALVRLADGRYALTGQTVAVGPAAQLRRYLRNRRARSPADHPWLTGLERSLDAEAHGERR